MGNEEPVEGLCNAKNRNGNHCGLVEGYGTDNDSGRCKYHGGCGGGEPGNVNGQTHGIHTKRSNYYSNLDAEGKAWVDACVESMLGDAPFGKDNFQKFQMLRNIAIDMHKVRRANDYIAEEGIVQENMVRDEEGNPIMKNGEYITETDENPVNLAYDRLNRTMVKQLKELGLLDDPESQKAQAGRSISEQLATLRDELE